MVKFMDRTVRKIPFFLVSHLRTSFTWTYLWVNEIIFHKPESCGHKRGSFPESYHDSRLREISEVVIKFTQIVIFISYMEVSHIPIDTKRLVRISLYPSSRLTMDIHVPYATQFC